MRAYVLVFKTKDGATGTKFFDGAKKPGKYEAVHDFAKKLTAEGLDVIGLFHGKMVKGPLFTNQQENSK